PRGTKRSRDTSQDSLCKVIILEQSPAHSDGPLQLAPLTITIPSRPASLMRPSSTVRGLVSDESTGCSEKAYVPDAFERAMTSTSCGKPCSAEVTSTTTSSMPSPLTSPI